MYEVQELIDEVIFPTLAQLGIKRADNADTNLLLGTFAQESTLGSFDKQIGGGPALGIGQIEPRTNQLVLNWLIENNMGLYHKVMDIRGETTYNRTGITADINRVALQLNDKYNCAIARCLYLSISVPLPDENNIDGMARYWKQYYNSPQGAGTVAEWVHNYNSLVLPFLKVSL